MCKAKAPMLLPVAAPPPAPLPPDQDNGGMRGSVGQQHVEQRRAAKLIGRNSLRIDRVDQSLGAGLNSSGLNTA